MMGPRYATPPLRLLIVDGQRLVAHALESLLRERVAVSAIAVATGWVQAAEAAAQLRPNVVLVDPFLPEVIRFQSIRSFAAAHPSARLVFLDGSFRPVILRIAIALDACGYWSKQASVEQIAEALPMAAAGIWTACPEAAGYVGRVRGRIRFRRPPEMSLLTHREIEVLCLLAQGLSVKESATRLRISPNTIDNHKSRLMKKLGLHRLSEVVLWATREGLG
jgi:DNA-binding NarL/FixJ family response regulator